MSWLMMCCLHCSAQITILGNTNVVLHSGTQLKTGSLTDTIYVNAGANFVNDGIVELDSLGYISDEQSPITGMGLEHYRKDLLNSVSSVNPGGLGFIFNSNTQDSIGISRYHSSFSIGGGSSVNRYYSVNRGNPTSQTISFDSHSSELNGNIGADLILASSFDNGVTWEFTLGTTDQINTRLDGVLVDSFAIHTLIDYSVVANVADETKTLELDFYPNPVNAGGEMIVVTNDHEKCLLIISDMQGRIVYTTKLSAAITHLSLYNEIAPGLYNVTVFDDSSSNSKKLVVK